jgi:acetyl-CoA carboxylase biotin carboxyl carrier protein
MAEDPSASNEPLDVQKVHYLVRLMKRYDLTALDLSDGTVQIRLRRRGPEARRAGVAPASAATAPAPASPDQAGSAPEPRLESVPTSVSAAPKTIVIESPMVGTYFSSSAPDVPPFVSVGSVVHAETIVCIIEAMKVFTDIPAGVSGTIAAILVKNGQAVEYGQPLFRLIPS